MNTWKHTEWKTFPGTWMITSHVLNDEQIKTIITTNPHKYGSLKDWNKNHG